MISVDGMKPEYATQADRLRLKVPFLRSLIAEGTYADGVEGVWPTNTYPSHTTLVTGVSPARHGIYNNLEFDPRRYFGEAWFWYAREIRVPTLWQVARRSGLSTASVGWPASVGATDVDFLIPEYWRIFRPTLDLNPADRYLIAALSRPEGMLEQLEKSLGPYLMGNDTSDAADEIKTRFAEEILRTHHPQFMTVHLSSLDSVEHEHGPFSAAANQSIEATDIRLARLVATARTVDPSVIAVIVSDHGFTSLTHALHLYIPFIRAGLLELGAGANSPTSVASWKAAPWTAGGMAAVVLRDANDEGIRQQVRDLLRSLAADPHNGIAEIVERDTSAGGGPAAAGRGAHAPDPIAARGAFPDAAFLVVMQLGYYAGGNTSGELVTDMNGHGGHGFAPTYPDMRAAFFARGAGIARHRDLGVIDMRQIAPTVAGLLNLNLPGDVGRPLSVRQ